MTIICLCVRVLKYIDFDSSIEHREFTNTWKRENFLLLSKMLEHFRNKDEGFWVIIFRELEKNVPAG